jgi:hypothetical protein
MVTAAMARLEMSNVLTKQHFHNHDTKNKWPHLIFHLIFSQQFHPTMWGPQEFAKLIYISNNYGL